MKKRPRDPNQLAKLMIDIATGQVKDEEPEPATRRAKGGHARAAALTAEQRRDSARKAAARWKQVEARSP